MSEGNELNRFCDSAACEDREFLEMVRKKKEKEKKEAEKKKADKNEL